jgi:uncharacterized protein (DUF1778 family)
MKTILNEVDAQKMASSASNRPKDSFALRDALFHAATVPNEDWEAFLRMLDQPASPKLIKLMSQPDRWV